MKNILLFLTFVYSATFYAQDPMLQKDAPSLEDQAYEITQNYNEELGLNGKQVTLFEKKVEEFLIRRKDIEEKLEGREKLNALFNLQTQETLEMNNILTQPQLDLYKKIKTKIQPVARVEEEKSNEKQ